MDYAALKNWKTWIGPVLSTTALGLGTMLSDGSFDKKDALMLGGIFFSSLGHYISTPPEPPKQQG